MRLTFGTGVFHFLALKFLRPEKDAPLLRLSGRSEDLSRYFTQASPTDYVCGLRYVIGRAKKIESAKAGQNRTRN